MLKHHKDGSPFVVAVEAATPDDPVSILSTAASMEEAEDEIQRSAEAFGRGDVEQIIRLPMSDHRQLLAIYHQGVAEPMLLVYSPPLFRRQHCYPVVDGEGNILGEACDSDEAVTVANLVYDGDVIDAELVDDVVLDTGDTVALAWIAMQAADEEPDTVRIVMDVRYHLNGEDISDVAAMLEKNVRNAIEAIDLPLNDDDSQAVARTYSVDTLVLVSENEEVAIDACDDEPEVSDSLTNARQPMLELVVDNGPRSSGFDDVEEPAPGRDCALDPHGSELSDLGLDISESREWKFAQ